MSDRSIPRIYIFLIDLFVCTISFTFSFVLRFNFSVQDQDFWVFIQYLLITLLFRTLFSPGLRTYRSIIRYSSTNDAIKIFAALSASTFCIELLNITYFLVNGHVLIPTSIILIDFFISVVGLVSSRLTYKILYNNYLVSDTKPINVIIYGAGQSAIITKRTLDQDTSCKYHVLAFIDDNKQKAGRLIEGIKIYHGEFAIGELIDKYQVDQLIISIQNISPSRKKEIVEHALNYNVTVKDVPPAAKWINGELTFKQIKNVKIEDLLNRDPIQLNKKPSAAS